MKTVTWILLAVALSGCMTSEQRAAEDDAICQGYHLPPGTVGYQDCRQYLASERRTMGMAMAATGGPWPAYYAPSRPVYVVTPSAIGLR